MAPLTLAYAASSLVWLVQSPRWLQALWAQALGLVVLSWLASSVMGLAALRLRWHAARLHGDALPSHAPAAARNQAAWFQWTPRPLAVQAYHLLALQLLRQRTWLWHTLQTAWLLLAVVFWVGLWQGCHRPPYWSHYVIGI